ncbi:MAG: hypothetical protein II972_04560 [Elusimicrobiaceae bacterium]|nr:hypothetical protein [Elusimicrobiaceae bacterium]
MANIHFGTDGWRGIIAWDFTFDNVRTMAQALADFISINMPSNMEDKTNLVAVGYDRRFLSEKFASDIASILKLNKLDVVLLDSPVPSPLMSVLSSTKVWISIMVTASHNAPHYNGIKIKLNGAPIPTKLTKEIEELLYQKPVMYIPGHNVAPTKGLQKNYFKYISSKVNLKKIALLKGKIAVDYMHGSASTYLEQILGDKKILSLRSDVDPTFGSVAPEPKESNLSELKKLVVNKKCLMGIAFDGDGDRIAFIDEKGKYISPCLISAVALDYLVKHKKLTGNVVQCVSMGYLTKRIAEKHGLGFEEVPVGFKNIAEKNAFEDIAFGAEESGGYFFKGLLPERDAITFALFIMEVMANTKKSLSQLCQEVQKEYGASVFLRRDFELTKELEKTNFNEKFKKKLPKKILNLYPIKNISMIDGIKITLDKGDWVLLRPSGTEPKLRIYAETPSKKQTEELLDWAQKTAASIK